jgi:hypothetical protein
MNITPFTTNGAVSIDSNTAVCTTNAGRNLETLPVLIWFAG